MASEEDEMRFNRLFYFLWFNLLKLWRNRKSFFPTFAFMTLALSFVFVLLSCFFCYYFDLRAKLKNGAWDDVIIWNDHNEQLDTAALNAEWKRIVDIPWGTSSFIVDDSAALTYEDIKHVESAWVGELELKVSIQTYFYDADNEQQFTLNFLSKPYWAGLGEQIQGKENFFVVSRQYVDLVKERTGEDRGLSMWQFPYFYDGSDDEFYDREGNQIEVFFLEDLPIEQMDLYSHFVQLDTERMEYAVLLPVEKYFSVYYPLMEMDMRVSAKTPEALAEFLTYMNTAHHGKVSYSCTSLVEMYLQDIYSQRQQFFILVPMCALLALMIAINFIGIQYFFQKRRRLDMAIQIACGARTATVIWGVFFSSIVPICFASIAAIFLGMTFLAFQPIEIGEVRVVQNIYSTLSTFGYALVLAILSGIPSIVSVRGLEPTQILTTEAAYD